MPVYELKKMYIEQECKFWIEHPLVGICEEQLSEQGRYQMIINPEIIGGKENGCKSSMPQQFKLKVVPSLKGLLFPGQKEVHYIGGSEVLPALSGK